MRNEPMNTMVMMKRDRKREKLYHLIFKADTKAAKIFDICLLVAILSSIVVIVLDSVPEIRAKHHGLLYALEWFFTGLFTIEYILRIYCARKRLGYIFSFFGIIDLISVLPTYIMLFMTGGASIGVVRAIRLLRTFRVFKLMNFLIEADALKQAFRQSRAKIAVFLSTVVIIVVIVGSAMYLIEKDSGAGFDSIPQGMYWAVVTMTTVGYGDISPITPLGKFVASLMMIVGYSLIIVPTGIISAELSRGQTRVHTLVRACAKCGATGHKSEAKFCYNCGSEL